MNYRFLILVITLEFFPTIFYSQKEANFWYFGLGAALDFNSGNPLPVTGSAIATNEGCATISHSVTGQLLFYTDGITIWDKTNNQMPNGFGLWGNSSSTQSGVIIPKPGSSTLYYVFSVDAQAGITGYGGVSYSVVDMTLNGGNGDVTIKNQPLLTPTDEKLTALRHCNGNDIWIITHLWNSNSFYAYLITSAGIGAPVISSVGPVHQDVGSGQNAETIGYLKISPDGKKLAEAIWINMNLVVIYDFDITTGIISNPIIDNSYPPPGIYSDGPYGLSFSPDNNILYISVFPHEIYQYNLLAGTPAAILSSKTLIHSDVSANYGDLQLAINGKIYVTSYGNNFLDVINNPNSLGAACNYYVNAVSLGTGTGTFGLPNFLESVFNAGGNSTNITTCTIPFTLNAGNGSSFLWSTGETTQTIQVSTAGTYYVQIVNTICNFSDTDTFNVSFISPPVVNLGNDTSSCDSSYFLDAGNPGFSYYWSTGETTQTITADSSGIYWVNVYSGTCSVIDSINISLAPYKPFSNDTSVCMTPFLLDAGNTGSIYLWSTGETTQQIYINSAGIYWVKITNGICITYDTIQVTVAPLTVNLGNDTNICGSSFVLDAGNPGYFYWWSTGEFTQTITVTTSGYYSVQVYDALFNCYASDDIFVSFDAAVDLGSDIATCLSSVTLDAGNPGATYLWSNGATSQTITVNSSGNYWVQVTNGSCVVSDTINVAFLPPPAVNLGNDTVICSGSIILDAGNPGYIYWWSTGETTQTITVTASGNYSVSVYDNSFSCIASDNISITIGANINLGNDTSLCTGTLLLNAQNPGAAFLWSTGATTQTITVNSSGNYWVLVTNGTCIVSDTVNVTFLAPPNVNLGDDSAVCNSISLNAGNAGYNYLWSTGETTQTIQANLSGNYSVTVSLSGFTCTGSDTIYITVVPLAVSLGNDIVFCDSAIILDAGNQGAEYLWSTGETTQTINILNSGTYWVQTNKNGCAATDTIQFFPFEINLGNDTFICSGPFTIYSGVAASNYLWSTGSVSENIIVNETGTYWIKADNGTCSRTDSVFIEIYSDEKELFAPNVFTPNSDGKNDYFEMKNISPYGYNLKIFNRWGKQIFESSDMQKIWDGKYKGNELDEGVYFWVLKYTLPCRENENRIKNGTVTLLR